MNSEADQFLVNMSNNPGYELDVPFQPTPDDYPPIIKEYRSRSPYHERSRSRSHERSYERSQRHKKSNRHKRSRSRSRSMGRSEYLDAVRRPDKFRTIPCKNQDNCRFKKYCTYSHVDHAGWACSICGYNYKSHIDKNDHCASINHQMAVIKVARIYERHLLGF